MLHSQILILIAVISATTATTSSPMFTIDDESEAALEAKPGEWIEKMLVKFLFEHYDKRSRPVVDGVTRIVNISEDHSVQQITIEFGFNLIQILDLNEMDQVLTTSSRSLFRWTDPNFVWDPERFGNISVVNVPSSMLWIPDISLYNYADERLDERRSCDVKIYNDGTVDWQPMAIYKSTCSVNIKYFPFDEQRCWLKFGPWTYDGYRVNISYYNNIANMDRTNFIESPEWSVLATAAKHTETKYPCCPELYPDIKYYIWIKREPAFYTYILILPCFLLSMLTLVLFWLPPESPAKMVLGMNIFVAFFLLLLLLEDTTPSASSNFPLIGTYYCLNMGLITFSSFLSCLIVNFHFRGDNQRQVPQWIKKILFLYIAKILFVRLAPKIIKACHDAASSLNGTTSQKRPSTVKFNLSTDNSTDKSPSDSYSENTHMIKIRPCSRSVVNSSSSFSPSIAQPPTTTTKHNKGSPQCEDVYDWQQSIGRFELPQSKLDLEIIVDQKTAKTGKVDELKWHRFHRKVTSHIREIVKNLRYLQHLQHIQEINRLNAMEWRSVGTVVDRLFFVCYIFITVLSMASYFPRGGESRFDVDNPDLS